MVQAISFNIFFTVCGCHFPILARCPRLEFSAYPSERVTLSSQVTCKRYGLLPFWILNERFTIRMEYITVRNGTDEFPPRFFHLESITGPLAY